MTMLTITTTLENGDTNEQIIIAAVNVYSTGTYQTLIEFPDNQVSSEENQESAMSCRSDQGYKVSWYVRQFWSAEKVELWNGYRLSRNATSYCSVKSSVDGLCNLTIYHRSKAAQTYICFEPGTLQEFSAELIFIGWYNFKKKHFSSDDQFDY